MSDGAGVLERLVAAVDRLADAGERQAAELAKLRTTIEAAAWSARGAARGAVEMDAAATKEYQRGGDVEPAAHASDDAEAAGKAEGHAGGGRADQPVDLPAPPVTESPTVTASADVVAAARKIAAESAGQTFRRGGARSVIWTPERVAILRQDWPAGVGREAIPRKVMELPGEPVEASRLSIKAAELGLRRPEGFEARRPGPVPPAPPQPRQGPSALSKALQLPVAPPDTTTPIVADFEAIRGVAGRWGLQFNTREDLAAVNEKAARIGHRPFVLETPAFRRGG